MWSGIFLIFVFASSDLKREADLLLQSNPTDARAGEMLEKHVAAYPRDAEAHYLLGRWALVKGKFARAVEAETRAAQLSADNPRAQIQAWTIVAVANDRMNLAGKADAAFLKAIALNRRLDLYDPHAAYQYLKILERDHREDEARRLAAEILQRSPQFGPAHLSLGKVHARAGRDEEAAKEAELALTRLEGDRDAERDAHYLLARLYLRLRQPERAELHKRWLTEVQ